MLKTLLVGISHFLDLAFDRAGIEVAQLCPCTERMVVTSLFQIRFFQLADGGIKLAEPCVAELPADGGFELLDFQAVKILQCR